MIYWNRNFHRDATSIFVHLVEVVGGLSLLASDKSKPGVEPVKFVAKCFAWWLALCGKVGIRSVSDLIWAKFPGVCAYCHENPHDDADCQQRKTQSRGPDWKTLAAIGLNKPRPTSLKDWQQMFASVYPAHQVESYGMMFGRLMEELGELAESIRILPAAPGYFLSEAADVFAWLMHAQNLIEQKANILKKDRGNALEQMFIRSYPDKCLDCESNVCSCPAILEATIGRIAHEVPSGTGTLGVKGCFLTADEIFSKFQLTVPSTIPSR